MRTNKPKKKTYKRYAATMNEADTFLTIDGIAYKDERLKDFNIKALYSRIKMYVNLKPDGSCFASNKTLSKYIGKSPSWIGKKISFLKELKYIYEESFDGKVRHLKLCSLKEESEFNTLRKLRDPLVKITRPPRKNYEAEPILPYKEYLKRVFKNIYREINFTGDTSIKKDLDKSSKKENKISQNNLNNKSSKKENKISQNNLNNKSSIPKEQPPIEKIYNQRDLNLSSKLLYTAKKEHPSLTKNIPSTAKINGAVEIAKLQRIDKFSFQEIKSAILWAPKDSFWGSKILSCASIRNRSETNGNIKFLNLFIAYQESTKKKKISSIDDMKKRGSETYNKVDMKPQM